MAKSYTSRAPGFRSVRLDLEEGDHDRLRVLAAEARQPMSRFVRGIVLDHLQAAVARTKSPRKNPRKSPEDC